MACIDLGLPLLIDAGKLFSGVWLAYACGGLTYLAVIGAYK